jgi:hypothetical protein
MLGVAISLSMLLAACGGGDTGAETPATPAPANTTDEARTSDSTAATADSTGSTAAPVEPGDSTGSTDAPAETESTTDPNAVVAPDFTLALGEGGEFALSAETKPVFLVFWAEW